MRKRIVILILIISCLSLTLTASVKKAEKYYKKAEKYFLKKDYVKAQKFLEKSLNETPDYPQSLFLRGNIFHYQKNYPLAYKDLKKANEAMQNQNSVHSVYLQFIKNYSLSLIKEKKYIQAMEITKEMLKNKSYANLLIKEGSKFMKGNEFIASSYYSIALLLENKGELPHALETYSLIIENEYLKDNSSKAKNFYFNSLYRSGLLKIKFNEIAKGEELLRKFLKESNKYGDNQQLSQSMIILANNKLLEIRNKLEELNDQNDGNIKTKIKELAKKNQFIEEYYQKLLSLNPNIETIYQNLATYYYWCEEYKKATQIYDELIKKFPNSKNKKTYIESKKIIMNEQKGF